MGGGIRVEVGDRISFLVWSSQAITLRLGVSIYQDGCSHPPAHNIDLDLAVPATRAQTALTYVMKESGWLDSASVTGIGGVGVPFYPGITFCIASLDRGPSELHMMILEGYFYQGHQPSYPGILEGPFEGHGAIRVIDLGHPAAGAEYATVAVPAGAAWMVRSFSGSLVSSATVANRIPGIRYQDAVPNVLSRVTPGCLQAASLTVDYSGFIGACFSHPSNFAVVAQAVDFPLPEIFMLNGYQIAFGTLNLQAADNWGNGFLVVEEWISPQ